MNLIIPLPPDLDSRLREEAARLGVEPTDFVLGTLRRQLSKDAAEGSLSAEESELLEAINRGLSPVQWRRYDELIAKRGSGELDNVEVAELMAMTDQVESLNASRMRSLAELARLRGIALPELMEQLQIVAPPTV